jgi:hypothetical protein
MSNTDTYLSRASHFAQIVLVCVAVFGYFATVRPVYQKELLAEQVAQKQAELDGLVEDLKLLTREDSERIAKSVVSYSAVKCTGLLDTPEQWLLIGEPVEKEPPTYSEMVGCVRSNVGDFSQYDRFSASELERISSIFDDFASSEAKREAVDKSGSPEDYFRNLVYKIDWSKKQ